jgi:glycosyltransferase involved in cell wall biosynthesis
VLLDPAVSVTMPVHILHLRDTDEVGGPGKTILETANHIDRDRFTVSVGVFRRRSETGETPFMEEARRYGVDVFEIRSRGRYDPGILREVAALVRRRKIDLLATHESKSDILGILVSKWCRIPVVSTMHGWITNDRKQRVYHRIDKRIARYFDGVIVVNRVIRDTLIREGVRPEIVHLLHNSIVTEKYFRDGETGYLGRSAGRVLPSPVIGTLGRVSPEKGQADFVEAAALVARRGYAAHFVIVGDGPDSGTIRRMIEEKGLTDSVTMTGYLRDPRRVLQEFDLMVLPSHTEGLPNVVLEAFMMNVPVISTAVGGVPEVIRDGENGVLIPPGKPEEMAAAIVDFLDFPQRHASMARAGKETVRERFDFKARTRKLEAIYLQILKSRGFPLPAADNNSAREFQI